MDQLTVEQRESLTKTNTERLRVRLVKAGYEEDAVFAMDRTTLLNEVAKVVIKGPERAEASGGMKPMSIWEKELALREEELQMRREERIAEQKRWDAMDKQRQLERAEEEARRKAEDKRWMEDAECKKEELRLRDEELKRQQRVDAARQKEEDSLLGRTKKVTEVIKNIIPSQPSENAELPAFFESVENLFKLYGVSNDLKSKILLPKLTGRTRAIVNKLSLAELDDYEAIKKTLLTEFKLTPRELRSRFVQASKRIDESWVMFTSRLENLLLYYLKSREADTDVKKLIDLIVSDKLKDVLPTGALQYVLNREGEECFSSAKIAYNADIHVSNYNEKGTFRGTHVTDLSLQSGGEIRTKPLAR